jgi:uncharacterized membrane protein
MFQRTKKTSKRAYGFAFALIVGGLWFAPLQVISAENEFVRATVVDVLSESSVYAPGLQIERTIQNIRAQLDTGEYIEIENDRFPLEEGDAFFARFLEVDGEKMYTVQEPDRRMALGVAVGIFALVIIVIGRLVGLRSLVSLGVSFAVIIYGLLPALASGFSPIVVSITLSAVILALAMSITHGISRTTLAAFLGSIATILVAIFLGNFFVSFALLTGFADDTATILNLSTGGALNMQGILLGALIIGILGIIDDLTVTQVATVSALHEANATLTSRELYTRAMGVGREHLGAVVNTLFLAYAGAAMPLLLLFALSPASPLILVNSEIIAIEIIRAAIGGAALALAVPIATFFGIWALRMPKTPFEPKGHLH